MFATTLAMSERLNLRIFVPLSWSSFRGLFNPLNQKGRLLSHKGEVQQALAVKLATKMVDEMLFIGTVLAPSPLIHNNDLKNVAQFKTTSYEYYRTFPYLPQQWWLDE